MQAIRGSIKELVYYTVGFQQMTEEQVFHFVCTSLSFPLLFHSLSNALYQGPLPDVNITFSSLYALQQYF